MNSGQVGIQIKQNDKKTNSYLLQINELRPGRLSNQAERQKDK